jgi:hypothetical protein
MDKEKVIKLGSGGWFQCSVPDTLNLISIANIINLI